MSATIPRRVLIAALLAGVTLITPLASRSLSEAQVVQGEYSLYAKAPAGSRVGQAFVVKIGIAHGFGVVDCSAVTTASSPIPGGCYKGVEWSIGFDSNIVSASMAQVTRNPAAPTECNLKFIVNSGPDSYVRVACADTGTGGVTLNYSGDAWNIAFTCMAAGTVQLPALPGPFFETFVTDGVTVSGSLRDLPSHTHGDSGTCRP